jgi:hypothetical protein
MGGIIDRLTGDRVRPETLREGDERETPLESFLRRTGRDASAIEGKKQLGGRGTSLEAELKERRRRLLSTETGPDAISGPGGIASIINKLGSNILGGPDIFGVPVNPLKLITNGFHLSQKHFAEPAAGYIVGGFSLTASLAIPGLRNTRIGETGREFYNEVIFGNGSFWSDAGTFQRDRKRLFWGEKLISTMVTDPLNLVGFGLMGKIPVIGRTALKGRFLGQRMEFSLGGIERGYIGATNLPFKAAGKVFKRFPSLVMNLVNTVPGADFGKISNRSRNQLVADASARASDIVRRAFTLAAGGKAHHAITKDEFTKFAAEAMEMSTPYGQLPSREHREFRDLMIEANPISRRAIQRIANAAGGSERVHRHQRFAVDRQVELAIRGRASVSEVAENIIKIVDGDTTLTKNVMSVESLVSEISRNRFRRIAASLSDISPAAFEKQAVRKAMFVERKRINARFEEWADDMGKIGGAISGLDRIQTRIWQDKIQRYLARPMATSILKTPEFLISNIPEDAIRAMTGQSSLVYRSADLMAVDFAGYSVVSRGLFQTQSPNVSRIEGLAKFDEFALRRDIGLSDAIPEFKGKKAIVDAGRLLGDVWFEKANQLASDMRRGFFTEHSYKGLAEAYQDEVFTNGLSGALGSLPDALANSDYGSIVKTATIRSGRGEGDRVRNLGTELTKEKVDLKNAIKIIDTMATNGHLDAETRALWHGWAKSGGDLNLLDGRYYVPAVYGLQ